MTEHIIVVPRLPNFKSELTIFNWLKRTFLRLRGSLDSMCELTLLKADPQANLDGKAWSSLSLSFLHNIEENVLWKFLHPYTLGQRLDFSFVFWITQSPCSAYSSNHLVICSTLHHIFHYAFGFKIFHFMSHSADSLFPGFLGMRDSLEWIGRSLVFTSMVPPLLPLSFLMIEGAVSS